MRNDRQYIISRGLTIWRTNCLAPLTSLTSLIQTSSRRSEHAGLQHDVNELVSRHFAVTSDVSLLHHLADGSVGEGQLLAVSGLAKIICGEVALLITVQHPETLKWKEEFEQNTIIVSVTVNA